MERQEVLRLRDGIPGDHPGPRGPGAGLSGSAPAVPGAFVPGPRAERAPTGRGPLDGLTFAVKDLIDVEGTVTGGGNPDWAAAHGPAATMAPAVAALLAAGAHFLGKTVTDELAFSLEGANAHFGTPPNPRAPGRLPGGSSSGSASAVAAGAVDIALGTDTGGSVRVPAAFCGLFGFRPTHGAIGLEGVVPFAPSYDTVGLLARDAAVLRRAAAVLLPDAATERPRRILLAEDAFALADPAVARALRAGLPEAFRAAEAVEVFGGAPDDWREAYRVLQGREIWRALGPWIERAHPRFGDAIAARFADAAAVTTAEEDLWRPWREEARRRLAAVLGRDGVLLLPTAPTVPLRTDAPADEVGRFYARALVLTSLAGHTGSPCVTLPAATVDGLPVGLSVVGRPGSDRGLLDLAVRVSEPG